MVLDDLGHDSWSGVRRARGGQGLAAAAQPGHQLHHGEDGDMRKGDEVW